MDKRQLAQLFEEIALLLDLKGENPFKTKAYINAARTLELLEGDIEDYIKDGKLEGIKGIGKAISEKIMEILETGKLAYYDELKSSIPEGLFDMLKIPGIGPKKVKVLYEKLGVKSVGELEYACIENRLLALDGFGEKTQANILKGIESMKKYKGQHLIGDVFGEALSVRQALEAFEGIIRCEIAGSLRRRKETVKDIDIVASSNCPTDVMEYFTTLPQVEEIVAKGDTKSSVRLHSGVNMDLRVVSDLEYPYALNHFTGSKEHNTAIRHRAKGMGIKANEYGLFRGDERIICKNEEDIYNALGLAYIPPELRENSGEIEAAERGSLPNLVTYEDMCGTFHMHTHYSDGNHSIEEMMAEAKKMGLQYIGISDHSRTAFYARGLSVEELKRQFAEIDEINAKQKDFKIFKGIESDILQDGSLDYDEDILALFDFVVASVHSHFKMERDKMTERLINAIKNPYTTMLGHPTGRILLARGEYGLDIQAVMDAAAEYGKIIEINADPHRLDLDWRHMKYAKEKGIKLSINTDAHDRRGLLNMHYGIGVARKGWLEKGDLINSMGLEEITVFLKKHHNKESQKAGE